MTTEHPGGYRRSAEKGAAICRTLGKVERERGVLKDAKGASICRTPGGTQKMLILTAEDKGRKTFPTLQRLAGMVVHTVTMVEELKRHGWSNSSIAKATKISRPHLVAFLAGRGHVGERKQQRLRRWCLRTLRVTAS